MSALAIVYSPDGDVRTVARGRVTALAITYDPPLRARRVAPPNLRPAPCFVPQGPDLSRLLARHHPILPEDRR